MGGEGVFEDADEGSWQGDVVDAECISKEWCHLFVSESGDATSDACHEKHLVGVGLSIGNKPTYGRISSIPPCIVGMA